MKKKLLTSVACCAMVLCTMVSAVGCNSSNTGHTNSTMTELSFLHHEGTGTRNGAISWIQDAAERFSKLKKDESYEDGKKGVTIRINTSKKMPYETLSSDGNDMYLSESDADMYRYSNYLMSVDEVVKSIEDSGLTIENSAKMRLVGQESSDGTRHYYGLPHYEWSNSITFDVDYFDEEGFYFAKEGATAYNEYNDPVYGTSKFVKPSNMQKSCGPDGKLNTADDGLPSSLDELAKLCSYIKSKGGSPFLIPGGGSVYSFHMVQTIWAALEGADVMNSLNIDYPDKTVNVVTGFKDDEFLWGDANIKKPIVEAVKLTEENGYKIFNTEARYYALAFMQLAVDKGWFHSEAMDITTGADSVQLTFIKTKNERAAMYIDGTYWYHEAKLSDLHPFELWEAVNPDIPRKLSYMNMPTQIEGSVQENQGKKNTILTPASSLIFVNKQVENNSGRKRAVLDFLKFLYTEDELATFTEYLGMTIPINFDYDETVLGDYYYTNYKKIVSESDIIRTASDNPIQYKNMSSFLLGFSGVLMHFDVQGIQHAEGFFDAFKNNIKSDVIFNGTIMKESEWQSVLKNGGYTPST